MRKTSGPDEAVIVRRSMVTPVKGTAGLECHLPGMAATVSSLANATGGIAPGHLVETAN